ncbi:calcium:proton antiporter [Polycladidibacter hongkongensis]|uniref:calcium:proton antiporter n=1 Tax=Polycladidibacter hongkongensis TaxID=1647556 RepID=UPI000A845343|nr:calcium:proton antiporter [Pseudovibrio hongkongensis]
MVSAFARPLQLLGKEVALPFALLCLAVFYSLPGQLVLASAPKGLRALSFAVLFAMMIWCAFAVVRHADALAIRLGEPFGTLILTLSVIGIEVSLIIALMLAGSNNPQLARDTMLAVINITMNGMVGLSLLLGALRYGEQPYNTQGARSFLSVLIPLAVFSMVLPRFTTSTSGPTLSSSQQIVFASLIVALYLVFLGVQSLRHRSFFEQPQLSSGDNSQAQFDFEDHGPTGPIWLHALLLIANMLPIVLLSKKLAVLTESGLEALSMPAALGGVLVAVIVLTPEGLSSFKAARANQLQRSVNICLGSALATIGLTVPAVLAAAAFLDIEVHLGAGEADLVMLLLTLALSLVTFSGNRTNILNGAVHLVLFLVFFALLLMP